MNNWNCKPEYLPWTFSYEITHMYLKNRLLLQETKKYIDKWNIDIIHSNASNLDFGQLVANKYGIPHVWHVREMLYNDYQLTYDLDN